MTANEREEEELNIKRQTLELERRKFRYYQIISFRDRLGTAVTKVAGALVFANASLLLISISYYKNFVEIFTKEIVGYTTSLLGFGLLFAVGACASAFSIYTAGPDFDEKSAKSDATKLLQFAIFAILSCVFFTIAVSIPLERIYYPPVIPGSKN